MSRGVGAPTDGVLRQRLVDGGQRRVDDLGVETNQIGDLRAGPHLPVLAGTPRAGRQFDRRAHEAVGDGVGQGADADTRGGQRTQHPLEPDRALVPPVPEQFGVERRDHVRGPTDAVGLRDQSRAHHLDEVGHVRVDGVVGALGVVRRLVLRGHGAARHPGRLEAGEVVVGVEVAVGGVARVARLRRPHPVAHAQVASERDHVGACHRSAEGGVAVQRRAVDHEVRHARRGVVGLPCLARTHIRVPRCPWACGRNVDGRRQGPRAARTRATAGGAAAGRGAPVGRRATRCCRRRSAGATAGCRRGATSRRSRRCARPASACSRMPNARNASGALYAVPSPGARGGGLACPQLPVGQPGVHAGQGSTGSSSCAVTTGVMPRVTR